MEDIPRELERELIAENRPRPVKRSGKWELLLLTGTGETRPVRHFKALGILLTVMMLTAALGSGVAFYYTRAVIAESAELKKSVVDLKDRERELRKEIDALVSRYMIESVAKEKERPGVPGDAAVSKAESRGGTGKKRSGAKTAAAGTAPSARKKSAPAEKPPEKTRSAPKARQSEKKPPMKKEPSHASKRSDAVAKTTIKSEASVGGPSPDGKTGAAEQRRDSAKAEKVPFDVAVNDFELTEKREENALKVKFIIKNQGKSPQNISGRIFVVLKPDDVHQEDWLISPETKLVDGKPGDALLGQFFSINRYKTVRLTLNSDRPVDYYKQCTVFVFNEGGNTLLEKEFSL